MSYNAWRAVAIYIIALIILILIGWRVYEATAAPGYVQCWESINSDQPGGHFGIGTAIDCENHG